MSARKPIPSTQRSLKDQPDKAVDSRPFPDSAQSVREQPQTTSPENTVMIGGNLIEIKPTKQKYQRNRTAMFYKMQELYPLTDIQAMDAGTFGDDRDGDKAVMDFLIAVTDDEEQIVSNYNEMDTGVIEKLLSIFRRVNRIDEKEAKQKNALAARKEG